VLTPELAEVLAAGSASLEAKLAESAVHPDPRIRDHFRQVPPYLRDLILSVTAGYTNNVSPGTHLRLVTSLLSSNHQIAFLDLNYDDYLETALADFDDELQISEFRDYVREGRQAIVGKVHGSVHWGAPFPRANDYFQGISGVPPLGPYPHAILEKSRTVSPQWITPNGEAGLYPILTVPLAGKGHTALRFRADHQHALQRFLQECERYLVIGTSGLDDDLLGYLDEYVSSVRTVHYVNYESANTEVCRTRFQGGCVAFNRASAVVPFIGGFRAYLSSREFERFLEP